MPRLRYSSTHASVESEGVTMVDDFSSQKYSEPEAKKVFEQILLGLAHLRSNDIVHVSLNPQKILLKKIDNREEICVLSFSISKRCEGSNRPEILAALRLDPTVIPHDLISQALHDAEGYIHLDNVDWEEKRRNAEEEYIRPRMEAAAAYERNNKSDDISDCSLIGTKCVDGIPQYACLKNKKQHKFCPECLRPQQNCPTCRDLEDPCPDCLKKALTCLIVGCEGKLKMFDPDNDDSSESSSVLSTSTTPSTPTSSSSVLSPMPSPSVPTAPTPALSEPTPAPLSALTSAQSTLAGVTKRLEGVKINESSAADSLSTRHVRQREFNSLLGNHTWAAGNSRLERNLFSDGAMVPGEEEMLSAGKGCRCGSGKGEHCCQHRRNCMCHTNRRPCFFPGKAPKSF